MTRGERFRAVLARGGPLLADGAMGTRLFEAGLPSGAAPELWNVERPEVVGAIHRGYLEAGTRIVLTNTFGGTRLRLALHGLDDRVGELSTAGARLARAAAEPFGALVAGDIGPSGGILAPLGDLDPAEAEAAFAEQAAALCAGGVDVLWIETMSALDEVEAAIRGVRRVAPDIAIVATLSFDTHGRTMMGVSPAAAAHALLDLGVAALGANCGRGSDEIVPVIAAMRAAAPEGVLVAKPNAGMPELVGDRVVYRGSPALLAEHARQAHEAGARILGACCGSTPAHIGAIAEALQAAGTRT